MSMDKVYLSACKNYDLDRLCEIVEQHFVALDVGIHPGMTVVIKPNLIIKTHADSGIITHPNLVAAVGICVKKRGAQVLIAESSGGPYTPAVAKSIFSGCGYTEMAKEHGFQLYTDCESSSVELPHGKVCRRLNVVNPFLNADYIINIPKLKSHCMTVLSGAVKNIFGTVPGLMKPELHCRYPQKPEFAEMLVDLCAYIRPNLSIFDAIDALEGDGPTGGSKRFVGAVISSQSPFAADMVAATIAGMNPADIPMLSIAIRRELCPKTVRDIELCGDSLDSLIVKNFKQPRSKDVDFISRLPAPLRPLAKRVATPLPVIKTKKCIGCGKCAESCPQHTIQINDKKAVISYSSCIRCFCCHEMCPLHVIDVKRFSLFNL